MTRKCNKILTTNYRESEQKHFACRVHFLITTLWANLADDKSMMFFLIFPERRLSHFRQIVSLGDNLPEILKPAFWENYENYFKMSAEIFTQC